PPCTGLHHVNLVLNGVSAAAFCLSRLRDDFCMPFQSRCIRKLVGLPDHLIRQESMWGGTVRLKVWAVLRLATGGATPHAPLAVQLSRPLRGASKQLFGAYLARFHARVGTNVPAGDGIGARTYVSSSPLMVVIVAFWSVPSKSGNVERST